MATSEEDMKKKHREECMKLIDDTVSGFENSVENIENSLVFPTTTYAEIAAREELDTETKRFKEAQKVITDIEAKLKDYSKMIHDPAPVDDKNDNRSNIEKTLGGIVERAKSDRGKIMGCKDEGGWPAVRSRLDFLSTTYRSTAASLRSKRTPLNPEVWAKWAKKQVMFDVIQIYLSVV